MQSGDISPQVVLKNECGSVVDFGEVTTAYKLLYWYPKADTPGCTAQAQGLRDHADDFASYDCAIFGASFDPVEDLATFHAKFQLNFSLLSDPDRRVGQSFGVAGADGSGSFADRVAFLLDRGGMVVQTYTVDDPEFFADVVLDDLEELA